MSPSDDECIAVALLHGAQFWHANRDTESGLWYLEPEHGMHPIEDKRLEDTGDAGWQTRGDVARAYCDYYNLWR